MEIAILYNGDDITSAVEFKSARFVSASGGVAGESHLRVRDKGHVFAQGYFKAGRTLELLVDGTRVWDGWVFEISREYAFATDNTTDPAVTPRWWVLDGFDRNILWAKRVFFDTASPENLAIGEYPALASDQEVIRDVLDRLCTMGDDGLDIVSGITSVGPIDPYQEVKVGKAGEIMRHPMDLMVMMNGAVYYIDPARVVRYVDDVTETAPYKLSDEPSGSEVGYRELMIRGDGAQLYNDALQWGIGQGSAAPAFARVEDQDSIDLHGRFQHGETYTGMWQPLSVQRRADTFVNGSPSHRRGHKDEEIRIDCVVYEPGLLPGMGIDFHSGVWDGQYDDIYPIRKMEMTFPTPTSMRYALMISHAYDAAWAFQDPPPDEPHGDDWITNPLPPPTSAQGDLWWILGSDISDFSPDIVGINFGSLAESLDGIAPFFHVYGFAFQSTIGPLTVPWFDTYCDGLLGAIYDFRHVQDWQAYGISPVTVADPNDPLGDPIPLPMSWWSYILRINSASYTGAASGFTVRYLIGPSDWDELWGQLPLAMDNGTLLADISSTKVDTGLLAETNVGEFTFPTEVLQRAVDTGEALWLIFTPSWQSARPDIDSYICLPSAVAPINSGLGNSGSYSVDWELEAIWNGGFQREVIGMMQNQPLWDPVAGLFQTGYPYIPGTLSVLVAGVTMTPGVDFIEVDPAAGTFQILDTTADLSQGMTVTYQRTVGSNPVPPEPGTTSGLPVDVGGTAYRPRGQRQLGWGTKWDGVNCGMTSSAMALDRHTLGAFSDINGYPLDNPPNMRNFSGVTEVRGTTMGEAVTAWANGWGESLIYPGYTTFDFFVRQIQSGRGAMAAGDYGSLPIYLKKQLNFNGPHAIFINEQLSDGSFWGFDPLGRAPIVYPYSTLQTYMQTFTGSGHVVASYTKITARVA